METRREQKSQWVAHLPDLLNQGQRDRTYTTVEAGGDEELTNEREGPQDVEEISPGQTGKSVEPLMEEAIRIYKSYIWGCKNLAWLFSDEFPEWLDTDPAEWYAVKKILQEFNHHDFIRQFPRVRQEVDSKKKEANYSDARSTDPKVLKQSGKMSKLELLKEVESKVIPPHKSTKHIMIDRMKEANRLQSRKGQSTCDGRGGNTDHSLTLVTKIEEYDKQTNEPIKAFPAEYHADDLLTVPRKIEGSTSTFTRHDSDSSVEFFDDCLNDSKSTILQNTKDNHREITSPVLVQSVEDLFSQNKAIEKGNKTNANRQIIPSSSVQSLDDLLNEALEAEEELERRRAEKSSTKIKSSPIQESSIARLQIVNGSLVKGEQSFQNLSRSTISPMDNCGILTISGATDLLKECKEATAKVQQDDFALQDLNIASIQGESTDRILASASLQNKGSQRTFLVPGETQSKNLTQDKLFSGGKTEYCERPKSHRRCTVPLEAYREIPIKCSLDNDVQDTKDWNKDLPPSRSRSNLSLFSELSADDWVLLQQGNTELSKSATTSIPEVLISGRESCHGNSSDSADCRYPTIPQERPRDNRGFNFFRRHFSSFRRKLRQFNCFSKS